MALWPDGARELAASMRVARLATAAADATPHAIPICYALNDDRLYFVIDAKPKRRPLALKRLRNIAENPRVAVIIDRYDDDWTRLEYVLLAGQACVCHDPDEYDRAIAALRDRYGQYRDATFSIDANPVVRVDIGSVKHWRFSA